MTNIETVSKAVLEKLLWDREEHIWPFSWSELKMMLYVRSSQCWHWKKWTHNYCDFLSWMHKWSKAGVTHTCMHACTHMHARTHTHTHTHLLKRQIVNTYMQVQQFLWNQMMAQSNSQDCPCTILRLLNKKIYGSSNPLKFVLFLECFHNVYIFTVVEATFIYIYIYIITSIYKMPYLTRVIVYNY